MKGAHESADNYFVIPDVRQFLRQLVAILATFLACAEASSIGTGCGVAPVRLGEVPLDESSVGSQVPPNPRTQHRPVTLHRLVRHFDFEEAEHAPHRMPMHWYRFATDEGAAAHGFPPFGQMHLTNEEAYSGRWSFAFELDGGSLAARVPTAVIPIMPMADYAVLTRVRTEGLTYARAGIAAWLYDQAGNVIPGSHAQSRLVRTDGQWTTIAVHIHGRFDQAADLAIELRLLQPTQFQQVTDRRTPLLEDVQGRAWFDDVTVWHIPHVDMVLSQPQETQRGNVAPARLTMMVLDLAHDQLEAHLRVMDLDGVTVFDRYFPAPRTPIPRSIDVPLEQYGWYRAVLDITHEGELTARRALDFIHAPRRPFRKPPPHADTTISFALAMPETWHSFADEVPQMVRQASVGTVILPILTRSMRLETVRELHEQARPAIEALRKDEIAVSFALSSMPEGLSQHLGVGGDDVLVALAGDPAAWREYIDDLLVNFAFEIERWQIGPSDSSRPIDDTVRRRDGGEAFWHRDLASVIAKARSGLSQFVPDPKIVLPLPIEHTGLAHSGEDARTISIPYAIEPSKIGSLQWDAHPSIESSSAAQTEVEQDAEAQNLLAYLELPPADFYEPRERMADLAFRVLHAWRRGISTVAIEPPWFPDQDGQLMPEPTLAAWRTLAAHLAGRRFSGELALGPGLHAWILEGVDRHDAALVAWCDRQLNAESSSFRPSFTMQLAGEDVTAVDLFGNQQIIPMRSREHQVDLREMPIFIEGISAPLVKFRGGFSLDPPLVPSELRAHEHDIVLLNPWDMPVSGTIQLVEDPRWRMTPRSQPFEIRPRSAVRLPVQIVLDRGIITGRKKLRAQIELSADSNYKLELETEIGIGIKDVDLSATWHVVRNLESGEDDLVITQYILNTGDPARGGRPINADAFVVAPNVRQDRRLIMGLGPGELAVRTFHIPGGARSLAGRSVRVGLTSRDSPARLNLLLHIPPLGEMEQTAVADDDAE